MYPLENNSDYLFADPMYDEARDYRSLSPDPVYAQPMKGRRKAVKKFLVFNK